jgi:NAD(P) transhydrogenase subunit alpha
MKVGIPSEIFPNELRVAATPKTVKRLLKQGFDVSIQKNAGIKANYSDK